MLRKEVTIMAYNERIFNILTEAAQCSKSKCSQLECDDACKSFNVTIGNQSNFSDELVDIKCTKELIPIKKTTTKDECGECCKETYYIDSRFLDIYMEDNSIENSGEAVEGICEHYNIDINDMVVVFECDEVNKGLVDHTKKTCDIGLLKKYECQIQNCINKGIQCAKRANS